jgi:cell division protein FtsZ
MVRSGLTSPDYIAANSDILILNACKAEKKIQLGVKTSGGLGCGGDHEVGKQCARENLKEVLDSLKGADMVFLMAGAGGGTGSGAITVVAEALAKLDAPPLVVGVVTTPFPWEECREDLSNAVIKDLKRDCNSVIVIPNVKICELFAEERFLKAKEKVDEILYRAVSGVSYLVENRGIINVDFADVVTVMAKKGSAIMGYGEASGEDRARLALEAAINNPLMSNVSLSGAKGVLVNVTADKGLKVGEMALIKRLVSEAVGPGVEHICGFMVDDELATTKVLKVIIVATGIDQDQELEDVLIDDFSLDGLDEELEVEMAHDAQLDAYHDAQFDAQLEASDEIPRPFDPSSDLNSFVVLEPVDLDVRRPNKPEPIGSGPLAPVPSKPASPDSPWKNETSFDRPRASSVAQPLSPIETQDRQFEEIGGRPRKVKSEASLGVSQVNQNSDYYDLPPRAREKKR